MGSILTFLRANEFATLIGSSNVSCCQTTDSSSESDDGQAGQVCQARVQKAQGGGAYGGGLGVEDQDKLSAQSVHDPDFSLSLAALSFEVVHHQGSASVGWRRQLGVHTDT